ncbi:MAG: hypothetical protein IJU41_07130 [Clostridia bacterium]|nr:hypothetical protein [Clostridia bacterium]
MKRYEKPTLSITEIRVDDIILTSEDLISIEELPTATFDLGNVDWKGMWNNFEG